METQKIKLEKKLQGMWAAANQLDEAKRTKEAEELRVKYWKKYRANKKHYGTH